MIGASLVDRLRGARNAERVGSWALCADGTLRIRPGRNGVALRCDAGTLVVTQEGDLFDHVLGPRDELTTLGRGLVVAWALSDAALTVVRRQPARSTEPERAPTSPGARPSTASR